MYCEFIHLTIILIDLFILSQDSLPQVQGAICARMVNAFRWLLPAPQDQNGSEIKEEWLKSNHLS